MVFVMKLSALGERKIIEILKPILDSHEVAVGIGDDCAAIDCGKNYLLITTDMINARTHIPVLANPFQIGWHLVAINLSDIAAKGGTPIGILTAVGLPKDIDIKFAKQLARGMRACADEYKVAVVGGDTKESETITLCGTAIGYVPKNQIMLRTGARVGDIIAVTRDLGKAGSALYAIKHKINPDEAIETLLMISPRIREGIMLARTKSITSSIDISDGLAASIYQLSNLNDVGYAIYVDLIPVSQNAKKLSTKFKVPIEEFCLYSGGDYELLVTVNPKLFSSMKRKVEKNGCKLTQIGIVTKEKRNILIRGKRIALLKNKGYEHFRNFRSEK